MGIGISQIQISWTMLQVRVASQRRAIFASIARGRTGTHLMMPFASKNVCRRTGSMHFSTDMPVTSQK